MRYSARKMANRVISFAVSCAMMITTLSGCGYIEETSGTVSAARSRDISAVTELGNSSSRTSRDSSSQSENDDTEPKNVKKKRKKKEQEEKSQQEIEQLESDIYSLVCSCVANRLSSEGFETGTGVAYTTENDDYSAVGIYFYSVDQKFFKDSKLEAVGFVEVVNDSSPFFQADNEDSLIVVDSTDRKSNSEMICTYSYDGIGSSHFVYKNRYVTYYQQTPMRVVYSIEENSVENYDLSLGSLYNYGNDISKPDEPDEDKGYIYDEGIFTGEYITHTSAGLFEEVDYERLERVLREFSEEQEKNGYKVEQFDIIYLSPELIQGYLDSQEEETFFGYSVSDLTEAFGLGTALEYKDGKLVKADYKDRKDLANYNWKSFLTKVGIGCGIIIVAAAITAVAGGATFCAAVVTIATTSVKVGLASGLFELCVETAKNISNGESLEDSIMNARCDALDKFADGFVIGSFLGGVHEIYSGVANPVVKKAGESIAKSNSTNVGYLRSKGVSEAWKTEQKAVLTGSSRYNWSPLQKVELIKSGKITGIEGHHIKTVSELTASGKYDLIADPNDIVFVTKQQHLLLHSGSFSNSTDTNTLVKLFPWAVKKVKYVLKAAA